MISYNPFIRWNPEEYEGIRKLSMATESLWLLDTFVEEFMDVDQAPTGLMVYVNSEGPSNTRSHCERSPSVTWTSSFLL